MVAPNGARRGKKNHPALPITIDEIAQAAIECAAAGAHALHAHVRDAGGAHTLDAVLYRELQAAIAARAPQLALQITTESAGQYTPDAQRQLLYTLRPTWASVSLAEMLSDGDTKAARRLYQWAATEGVRLQHILYTPDEVLQLGHCLKEKIVTAVEEKIEVLFVLGRYAPAVNGTPAMLADFLATAATLPLPSKFMVCAFGEKETTCLTTAAKMGGDCRVGFENNLHNADGSLAKNNAERVAEVAAVLQQINA